MVMCGLQGVGDGHGLLEYSTEHHVEIVVAIDLRQRQLSGVRTRTILARIHLTLTL
jgi:hypothetical protein